jgi:acyl carrier protein|tara:strand:- start:7557 stop:7790 length:234 start_codon:yes stop_codon:yes gene_type:complete
MLKQEFLELTADALDVDVSDLSFDTKLHELDEWDSIGQLSFIGLVDDNFSIDIDLEKLTECDSISQLFDYINISVKD